MSVVRLGVDGFTLVDAASAARRSLLPSLSSTVADVDSVLDVLFNSCGSLVSTSVTDVGTTVEVETFSACIGDRSVSLTVEIFSVE